MTLSDRSFRVLAAMVTPGQRQKGARLAEGVTPKGRPLRRT